MAYGLQINKATGGSIYNSDSVTWNQVAFFSHSGNASYSYPILTGKESLIVQMFINPPPVDRRMLAYNISVNSSGTIQISDGNETVYILVLMR